MDRSVELEQHLRITALVEMSAASSRFTDVNAVSHGLVRVLNLAFYKFLPLTNLPDKRVELKKICQNLELKGTLLLSPEGINGFIAGPEPQVREFQVRLNQDSELGPLEFKESYSEQIPFQRMRIKLKKEIIPVRDERIQPGEWTAPRLSATELKQWLSENRDFLLLDTRNRYEIEYGTFEKAQDLKIDRFQDFQEKLKEFSEKQSPEDRKRPLVMFCTGGIRCEKASVVALRTGFDEVYQLDSGILKYFEECGGSHYQGGCYVFDERVALTPDLKSVK
jgi:UPF0176 protein